MRRAMACRSVFRKRLPAMRRPSTGSPLAWASQSRRIHRRLAMKYVLSVTFGEPAEALLPRVPRELGAHLSRMHDFHAQGTLLMSGAFRTPGEPLSTMGVF